MGNELKTLGVSIDGVIRDNIRQFDKIYRKVFVYNPGLVNMDENYRFVDKQMTQDEEDDIDKIIKEKITLPIDTYDLTNHYSFESKEALNKFYYQDYAMEIFGSADPIPRAMDYVNAIQFFGMREKLFNTVLLSKESEMSSSATFHFLAKAGCKVRNIKFVYDHVDKWEHCDVLIDESPDVIQNKPDGKIIIKIIQPYNTYDKADFEFNSVNMAYNTEMLKDIFGQNLLNKSSL